MLGRIAAMLGAWLRPGQGKIVDSQAGAIPVALSDCGGGEAIAAAIVGVPAQAAEIAAASICGTAAEQDGPRNAPATSQDLATGTGQTGAPTLPGLNPFWTEAGLMAFLCAPRLLTDSTGVMAEEPQSDATAAADAVDVVVPVAAGPEVRLGGHELVMDGLPTAAAALGPFAVRLGALEVLQPEPVPRQPVLDLSQPELVPRQSVLAFHAAGTHAAHAVSLGLAQRLQQVRQLNRPLRSPVPPRRTMDQRLKSLRPIVTPVLTPVVTPVLAPVLTDAHLAAFGKPKLARTPQVISPQGQIAA